MIIILMGVSGSGKSTVGRALAGQLGWPFVDADDFHPPANVAKMHAGHPLTDEDRRPWLEAIARFLDRSIAEGRDVVLACSALKAEYRHYLRHGHDAVEFVCLDGPPTLIAERLSRRTGHFMDPDLLQSQLDAWEPPPGSHCVDITPPPAEVAAEIRRRLGLDAARSE